MLIKNDLTVILISALKSLGNEASIVEVCKWVWKNYEKELMKSGDLYFTWQYDIRWAATELRKKGLMVEAELSPKGLWVLK